MFSNEAVPFLGPLFSFHFFFCCSEAASANATSMSLHRNTSDRVGESEGFISTGEEKEGNHNVSLNPR